MSRVEIASLNSLVTHADVGGYSLPQDVLDAFSTYKQVEVQTLADPARFDLDQAAGQVVQAVTTGRGMDLLTLGHEVLDADRSAKAHALAQRIHAAATELAGTAAVGVASDRAEAIITDCLRPAYDEVLEQARTTAAVLDGTPLDPPTLLRASARIRTAYLGLDALVARRQAILDARRWANQTGHRTPQHDAHHLFSGFAKPMTFHPRWKPPARIPQIPAPEDPKAHLLWLVSPQAQAAQPWLPTVAEQDAAWWDLFGEDQTRRRDAALATRAYAGQVV